MKLIVGITGATGSILGIKTLEALKLLNVETHLILSKWAAVNIAQETSYSVQSVNDLASHVYSIKDLGARISSGSFKTDGMIITPCSMKSLASIRMGLADNLISRAADVVLKERRTLVMSTREAPLNSIHLENMLMLSQMGAVITPPVMTFYNNPSSIDDMISHTVSRMLDIFGLDMPEAVRWAGLHKSVDKTNNQTK